MVWLDKLIHCHNNKYMGFESVPRGNEKKSRAGKLAAMGLAGVLLAVPGKIDSLHDEPAADKSEQEYPAQIQESAPARQDIVQSQAKNASPHDSGKGVQVMENDASDDGGVPTEEESQDDPSEESVQISKTDIVPFVGAEEVALSKLGELLSSYSEEEATISASREVKDLMKRFGIDNVKDLFSLREGFTVKSDGDGYEYTGEDGHHESLRTLSEKGIPIIRTFSYEDGESGFTATVSMHLISEEDPAAGMKGHFFRNTDEGMEAIDFDFGKEGGSTYRKVGRNRDGKISVERNGSMMSPLAIDNFTLPSKGGAYPAYEDNHGVVAGSIHGSFEKGFVVDNVSYVGYTEAWITKNQAFYAVHPNGVSITPAGGGNNFTVKADGRSATFSLNPNDGNNPFTFIRGDSSVKNIGPVLGTLLRDALFAESQE